MALICSRRVLDQLSLSQTGFQLKTPLKSHWGLWSPVRHYFCAIYQQAVAPKTPNLLKAAQRP